jgi:2-C-methyl-D-erythritol 4-phosphate cytidylyltransferase
MELYVIIVAGGKGERFGTAVPKQFIEIAGKPLILRTFDAFSGYFDKAHFVLVLPEMEIGRWKHIAHHFNFSLPYTLIEGGPTRFHSVKNGLEVVPGNSLVAIHDASRPLVSSTTIANCIRTAKLHGNAVPVVPVTDSVRMIENGVGKALDRNKLFWVQTPQVFNSKLIKAAYNRVYNHIFTDDASVLEASGHQIFTVEGNPENIKITRPADLAFASYFIENNLE